LNSEKARQELSSKQRILSMRERSALFLADGIRTRDELVFLQQDDMGMLQKLMADGYLIPSEGLGAKAVRRTDFAVSQTAPDPTFSTPS
jgi:predicted subunit of tRNA(5-methylaminomethyl-2-thiouridylate) methyltransferase